MPAWMSQPGCRRRGPRRRAGRRLGCRPSSAISVSGWSGWCRSHTGRFDRMGGSGRSKLCGGGGERRGPLEGVAAPRVVAGRLAPPRSVRHTFHRNGSVEAPSRNAPTVEIRLSVGEPVLGQVVGHPPGHALERRARAARRTSGGSRRTSARSGAVPQPSCEQPAGELREPVVDAGEEGEHRAAEEHVVHVGHDEVRVVQRGSRSAARPASRRSGRRAGT